MKTSDKIRISDEEARALVERFQNGDELDFEKLYNAYYSYFKYFARKFANLVYINSSVVTFDDIILEASVALYNSAKSFDLTRETSTFSSYFYKAAERRMWLLSDRVKRNKIKTIPFKRYSYNLEKNEKKHNLALQQAQDGIYDAETRADVELLIKKAKKILKASEYYVFLRVFVNEESNSDIAREFKVSAQAISKLTRSACRKIRRHLSEFLS